jgi:hypothetical protein
MSDNFEKTTDQAAAFQKIWVETMTKTMQSAFSMTPESAPPEVLQQIRSGIFQALAKSWEEFMRSPEFLERMKQWMETAVAFRQMTNDFLAKARSEMQAPSRDDIDTVMLTVRHMEKRILDRVEQLADQINHLNGQSRPKPRGKARKPAARNPQKDAAKPASDIG